MKIELLKAVAGKGFFYPPGEHDVPKEIAEDLVKAGHAKKKRGPKPKDQRETEG